MKKTLLSLVTLLATFVSVENATAGGGTLNPISHACPTAIYSAADLAGEGRLEVSATVEYARAYVSSPTSCHYRVETLTINGAAATAVDNLELEFYSAGRMFLSLITAYGEKARYVANNGRLGEKSTATLFIVPGFEPADLYQPIRVASAVDIDFTVAASIQLVPIRK